MSQQQGQDKTGNDAIWMVGLFIAISAGIWHVFKSQIIYFAFKVKLYEAYAVNFLTGFLSEEIVLLERLSISDVDLGNLIFLSKSVGNYVNVPIILIILFGAYYLYSTNIVDKYKKTYSMLSLAKAEIGNWPQIRPALGLNLVKADIYKGPWAMAMSPIEFGHKHDLLIAPKNKEKTASLKTDKARLILREQLGAKWEGVSNLDASVKGLIAAFIARINRDRKASSFLLRELAKVDASSHHTIKEIDEVVNKYINSPLVTDVIKQHAYFYTVMAGFITKSRDDGVLASADFLWLKPFNRTLWYVLNCTGRQTPFVEVAAIIGHFNAEILYGEAINIPMIESSVRALEFAMTEMIYTKRPV